MLFIREEWVNRTESHMIGDSGVYETRYDKIGDLFRSLQREYGRCVSSMYLDVAGQPRIGWIFVQRDKYTDSDETYLRETAVTLHKGLPEKTVRYNYLSMEAA